MVPRLLLPPLPHHPQKAQCLCPTEDAGHETPAGFLSRAKASLDPRGTKSCPEVTFGGSDLYPQPGLGLTGAPEGGSWTCFSRRP